MWFRSWLDVLGMGTQPRRSRPSQRSGDRRRRQSRRLLVEGLELRQLLAFLPAVDFPFGANPVAVVAADTLSITGTFHSGGGRVSINGFEYPGTIGADLAEVYANSNENAWMLTLHGISYSHDYYYNEWGYGYNEEYITHVYATWDFEFFGPDADVLNEVVCQQPVGMGAFLELRNGYQIGSLFSDDDGP